MKKTYRHNKKTFINKLLEFVYRKIDRLNDKIIFRRCNNDVFCYSDCFATVKVLTKYINPKVFCDIGANKGQWSYVLGQVVDLEHVVLFEPQKCLRSKLECLDLNGADKKIFHCALGNDQSETKLLGGSPSASLLDASENQHDFFPGSFRDESEVVSVNRLDNIYQQHNLPAPDVIKIDVQGYELNVLQGGRCVLSETKFLVIELSFRDFYIGQPPMWELLKFLEEQNFILVDYGYALKASASPGEILQIDGIFMNRNHVDFACKSVFD